MFLRCCTTCTTRIGDSKNKGQLWHHLKRTVQRRLLSSLAPCRSANLREGGMMPHPPRKMGPTPPRCVRHAIRKVKPSRSATDASAFGIATRNVRTSTARSIRRSAGPSRIFLINEEASSMSAPSWMLALFSTYRQRKTAQSACVPFQFTLCYNRTLHVAARLSAPVVFCSTR